MTTNSKSCFTASMNNWRRRSRSGSEMSSISAPVRSRVAGTSDSRSTPDGMTTVPAAAAGSSAISAS